MAGTAQHVTVLEKQTDTTKERMKVHSDKLKDEFKEGRLSVPGD